MNRTSSAAHGSLLALAALASLTRCTAQDDATGQLAQDVSACLSTAPTVEGIDVSEFQGSIDWNAVHASGRAFAIARAGDGTYHDPAFAANYAGIHAAGMLRGAYLFFRPTSDPNAQADLIRDAVGHLGPGDLPVTIDVECMCSASAGRCTAGGSGCTSAGAAAGVLATLVDRVTADTGRPPMIYTGAWFWNGGSYLAGAASYPGNPLWFSGYASCATAPTPWDDWRFWQYSDGTCAGCPVAGSPVPGVQSSPSVDRDRFHGTIDDLNSFAQSNRPPRGYLDGVDCTAIRGWAQDEDTPDAPITVHIYVGAPAGTPGAVAFPVSADQHRDDLCTAIGSCNHGYSVPPPRAFMDNMPHAIYAYGIDAMGGTNPLLSGSPMTLQCAPPPPPFPAAMGVRRHVPDPDVFARWHFDWNQVAVLDDATINMFTDGPDWPDHPALVQAMGDPAVYTVEEDIKRHVPDPAALGAWQFDTGSIMSITTDARDADLTGPELPEEPFLARGATGTAVYVIDRPPPLWAQLVSDGTPGTLPAGESVTATLVLTNRGSSTWNPGDVWFAPVNPRGMDSGVCDPSAWSTCQRAVTVDAATAPGATGTFTVPLRAMGAVGSTVNVCWGLSAGGTHWFGDPGEGGPGDGAMCHAITIAAPGSDAGVVGGDDGGHATGGDGGHAVGDGGHAVGDGGHAVGDGGSGSGGHSSGGCGCSVPARRAPRGASAVGAAIGLMVLVRKRRRRA